MKNIYFLLIILSLAIAGSCNRMEDELPVTEENSFTNAKDGDIVPGQYIVLLSKEADPKSEGLSYPDVQKVMHSQVQKVLLESGISVREPLEIYGSAIKGFALKLSEDEVRLIEKNPEVKSVVPDRIVIAAGKPSPSPFDFYEGQERRPGIVLVGGIENYTGNHKAWILGTGICSHPDLNVDFASGKNFVSSFKPPVDDNGRGTHSAGIIAAKDNDRGVIGVAPGAFVVPIKVLNQNGTGYLSKIIAGVNFVCGNATEGDVVDIGFTVSPDQSFDDAVSACAGKGLYVSMAAGDKNSDVSNFSPCRINGTNLYTVAAINVDEDGGLSQACTSFSNYGVGVDYYAPGVNIYSDWLWSKEKCKIISASTGAAAAHLSGVLLATGGNPVSYESVTCQTDNLTLPIPNTGIAWPDPYEIKFNNGRTYGEILDYDGNKYKTIEIGSQTWMAENLRTTKYKDGTIIPNVTNLSEWSLLTDGAYCWYNNDTYFKDIYGLMYNGYAALSGNVCPTGWHVPELSEYITLVDYLGGKEIAGGKLKETGTTHWLPQNDGATNESGFTALPGGEFTDPYEIFSFERWLSFWWTRTWDVTPPLWPETMELLELEYGGPRAWVGDFTKNVHSGGYIRCVMDNTQPK